MARQHPCLLKLVTRSRMKRLRTRLRTAVAGQLHSRSRSANWPSGYYAVTITSGDDRSDAFFVVRPDPGDPAPILLVLSTSTYDAYNDWGGPSLYTGGTRVSAERPLAKGFLVKPEPHRRKMQPEPDREGLWFFRWAEPLGLSVWSGGAGWWNWERPFVHWATANGYRLDVAISTDLEQHPEVLDGHRLFVCVGHDEYWSWGMRDALDAHTAAGGNAAILSGNTCCWQVRFEDDHRAMTSYKYRADEDPVVGTPQEHLLSGAWWDRRIGRPETSTTGLTFSRGGYSRYGLGVPRASGAYTVHRPDHWLFEGTDLRYGDALGLADTIVAYEVDGCELRTGPDGLPAPTHADGAPETLEVLATAPARLWRQDEQPSRYAHEPGELEHTAMALYGEDWRAHVGPAGQQPRRARRIHDAGRRHRRERRRDRLGLRPRRPRRRPHHPQRARSPLALGSRHALGRVRAGGAADRRDVRGTVPQGRARGARHDPA